MGKIKDLTGQRFGKLVAIECVGKNEYNRAIWLCACDCGETKVVSITNLGKSTKSCGCSKRKEKSEVDIAEEINVSITSFQEVKHKLGFKGELSQEQREEVIDVVKDIKTRYGRVALSDINRYWYYVRKEAKQ